MQFQFRRDHFNFIGDGGAVTVMVMAIMVSCKTFFNKKWLDLNDNWFQQAGST